MNFRAEIESLEKEIAEFNSETVLLNAALNECREGLEQLKVKDVQLEKNYRKELPKIPNNVVDHYMRVLR